MASGCLHASRVPGAGHRCRLRGAAREETDPPGYTVLSGFEELSGAKFEDKKISSEIFEARLVRKNREDKKISSEIFEERRVLSPYPPTPHPPAGTGECDAAGPDQGNGYERETRPARRSGCGSRYSGCSGSSCSLISDAMAIYFSLCDPTVMLPILQ